MRQTTHWKLTDKLNFNLKIYWRVSVYEYDHCVLWAVDSFFGFSEDFGSDMKLKNCVQRKYHWKLTLRVAKALALLVIL